jgi:hypothetical protein
MKSPMPTWELVEPDRQIASTSGMSTSRLPVPGGWIYRHEKMTNGTLTFGMVFVPDPQSS